MPNAPKKPFNPKEDAWKDRPIKYCSDCKFFDINTALGNGLCRRYAPRPEAAKPVWPSVGMEDWCGEFVVRPQTP